MRQVQSVRQNDQKYLALICLLISLVIPFLFVGKMFSLSVDVAHHYALIRVLMDDWGLAGQLPNLGEMNVYPRLAHWMAAIVGQVAGGSGLHGMLAVGVASVGIIYAIVAYLALRLGLGAFILVAGALGAIAATRYGSALYGSELAENFFYSQVVAQALAFIALAFTLGFDDQKQRNKAALSILICAQVVAFAHLLPALQILGAYALILVLRTFDERTRAAALRAATFCVGVGLTLLFHPSVRVMVEISRNNGGVLLGFHMTQTLRVALPLVAIVLSGALAAATWRQEEAGSYLGMFGITVGGLALVQVLALILGQGSTYAVDKHIFSVATMLVVNGALLASIMVPRYWQVVPSRTAAMLATLLLGAVAPFVLLKHPLANSLAIGRYQEGVKSALLSGKAPSQSDQPVFVSSLLPATANYMISIGDLRLPRNEVADAILLGKRPSAQGTKYAFIPADDPESRPECVLRENARIAVIDYPCNSHDAGLKRGQTAAAGRGARAAEYLQSGWSVPEATGVWSSSRITQLTIPVSPEARSGPALLVLEVEGFVVSEHPEVSVKAFLGEEELSRTTFRFPSGVRKWEIPIPDGAITNGTVRLRLEIDSPGNPLKLGLSGDDRELGIWLQSISLADTAQR